MIKEIFIKKTQAGIDIVQGDGEIIVPQLIINPKSLTPKIQERNNRFFKIDQSSEYYVENLDDVSLNRSIFLHNGISQFNSELEACIVSTRGCIYNCAFCGSAFSRSKTMGIRRRSVDNIAQEIDEVLFIEPRLSFIRFIDDLFLRDEQSIQAAIDVFSNFPTLKWRAMAHIQTFRRITVDTLKKLKEAGCTELFLGIESGSEKILKKIHKTSNINLIREVIDRISKASISIKTYFIYGFPGETDNDCLMTYNLAKDLQEICRQNKSPYRASVFWLYLT